MNVQGNVCWLDKDVKLWNTCLHQSVTNSWATNLREQTQRKHVSTLTFIIYLDTLIQCHTSSRSLCNYSLKPECFGLLSECRVDRGAGEKLLISVADINTFLSMGMVLERFMPKILCFITRNQVQSLMENVMVVIEEMSQGHQNQCMIILHSYNTPNLVQLLKI